MVIAVIIIGSPASVVSTNTLVPPLQYTMHLYIVHTYMHTSQLIYRTNFSSELKISILSKFSC